MGVEIEKRRVFARQIGENARQQRMFDDVGEITGVEGVTVIHANPLSARAAR